MRTRGLEKMLGTTELGVLVQIRDLLQELVLRQRETNVMLTRQQPPR